MAKHAFLSASGAPYWMLCEAKPWREKGLPDKSSSYAEEGTKAHEVLHCQLTGKAYIGDIPEEMQAAVNMTVELINRFSPATLYSEVELPISVLTNEVGASGTADIVMIDGKTLTIIDFKYGYGKVLAKENWQLLLYAAAALMYFDEAKFVTHIRLAISQPRIQHEDIWELSINEFGENTAKIRGIAERILSSKGGDHLLATPGDNQCHFCKARAICPEQREFNLTTVTGGFIDLDKEEQLLKKIEKSTKEIKTRDDKYLADCMQAVEMIERWCSTIKDEVETRLHQSNFTDSRFKLVEGRMGNRKWNDELAVNFLLATQGYSESAYEQKLLSPAKIEKIVDKETFESLSSYIERNPAKPVVVPSSDERPALDMQLDFKPIKGDDNGCET